jgi:hypothetical protein
MVLAMQDILNRLSRTQSGGINQITFFHWLAFDLDLRGWPSISRNDFAPGLSRARITFQMAKSN